MSNDTPVTCVVLRETHDPVDHQPQHLTLAVDDADSSETYLIEVDSSGAVLCKRVGFTQNEHMHFQSQAFTAIAEAVLKWNLQCQEWQAIQATQREQWEQAFVREQEAAAAARQAEEEGLPRCPEHDEPLSVLSDNGIARTYLCPHDHVVTPSELEAAAEANFGQSEQVEGCCVKGCINPAEAGYHVCEEHMYAVEPQA